MTNNSEPDSKQDAISGADKKSAKDEIASHQKLVRYSSKMQFFMVTFAFNVFWVFAVWGQYRFIYFLVAMLLATWWFFSVNGRFVVSASLVGIAMDFALSGLGFYHFQDTLFPLWLALLWLGFTTFVWIIRKVIQSYSSNVLLIIGSVGGMLSYIAGNRLQAVEWPLGWVNTAVMVALCWLVFSYILLTLLSVFSASQRSS
ncbi:hypothetical protein A3K86_21750 [Photobacterium jeanii]|uniref:Zinc ABC transporter permease n=1 Tax=Photobacterium jeanii TaxID=858640 RepID=A0A178K2P7_9GAMM|nr:DUF2878 domain-containing protein [Photobacterium jeanii]OAN11551.1 hypothetical protein A3K86_21750 [Photobacterium jeanii]PST91072.1 DUF2878 domain-containing protein [Photobacterium jeanii]